MKPRGVWRRRVVILLMTLLVALGSAVGCGQKQDQQDVAEAIQYLDQVGSLGIDYLKSLVSVLDAYQEVVGVVESRDEYRLLEVLASQKNAVTFPRP